MSYAALLDKATKFKWKEAEELLRNFDVKNNNYVECISKQK